MTTYKIETYAIDDEYKQWYAVHSRKWAGTTPTFRVRDKSSRNGVWTQDFNGTTWHDFTNNVHVDATWHDISMNTPFPNGDIWVCRWPMYPTTRTTAKVNEWLTSSYADDTPSTTNGIISLTTSRPDAVYGKTVPALPLHALRITNPASGYTKNKMLLTSGSHAGEPPAQWTLEGEVQFLLSSDSAAALLRDWFNIYVYPQINPQGRWAGCTYDCPEDRYTDVALSWATGTLENVVAIKAAITTDTGGTLHAGLDHHSFQDAANYVHYGGVTNPAAYKHAEWAAAMIVQQADYVVNTSNLPESMKTFFETLGAAVCVAAGDETSSALVYGAPIQAYYDHGEDLMRAMHALLVAGHFPNHP